jgi:Velvet factor
MAYLDRPAPAGYFIFPDLSVRHEGRYRLSFSLYEELKETKDMDTETPDNADVQKSAHVSHRLEVKSQVFTVFSAKKFPGLTESTALSRMVAEQGCRVRIRRDVRMRRRENKANRDYDFEEEEGAYERARASATPDAYHHPQMGTPQAPQEGMDRARSVSNASNTPYMPQRRASMEQMNQGYQQQYPTPLTPSTPTSMYPPSNQMPQWQQPQQPVSYMQPPAPPSYAPQQSYQQQTGPPMAPQYGGFMPPQYPTYNQGQHMRHNSMEIPAPPTGPAHTSAPQVPMPQYPSASQAMSPYAATSYSKPPQMSHAPILQPIQTSPQSMAMQQPSMTAPSQYSAAPILSPLTKTEPAVQQSYQMPTPQSADQQPPMQQQQQQQQYEYGDAAAIAPPPKFSHQQQPTGAVKRTYSGSFDTEHLDQRLQQGARPSSSAADPKYPYGGDIEDTTTTFDEAANMSYRRADGTERRRRVPLST